MTGKLPEKGGEAIDVDSCLSKLRSRRVLIPLRVWKSPEAPKPLRFRLEGFESSRRGLHAGLILKGTEGRLRVVGPESRGCWMFLGSYSLGMF